MRKQMVDKDHPQLSVRKQCVLLGVNRNRLEGVKQTASDQEQQIMRLLDEIHLREPTFGARRLRAVLRRGHDLDVGRKRLRRLMRDARIRVCYQRPRTSIPAKGHKKYPYLLCGLDIRKPDQVWCSDITYIPMGRGFCYLAAVLDWHTREVLGWAVSTTMDTTLCLDALTMALTTGRRPEIMNTDQGSQYTSIAWTKRVESLGIRISMDGKGRWIDNVRIERLWRSVKYEDVYMKAYTTPRELAKGLSDWFARYNTTRPHSALGYRPPSEFYKETAA